MSICDINLSYAYNGFLIEFGFAGLYLINPFEKSLNEMTIREVIDLGKRRYEYYKIPDPKNSKKFIYRGGSAMGKYQFVPATLETQAKKLYGKDFDNNTKANQIKS